MALKTVLKTLDGVNDALKGEYTQQSDGSYVLQLEGVDSHPDVGALKRAKDRVKDEKNAAETRAKALEDERDQLLRNAVPRADLERIEANYKTKHADAEAKHKQEVEALNGSLAGLLVDNVATSLAGSLAKDKTVIPVFMPHIRSRLRVERTDDGKHVTRVLDREGKPSAMTVADLEKEFASDPAFGAIVAGTQASGSGAEGGKGGGAPTMKVDLKTATPADAVAALDAKKAK